VAEARVETIPLGERLRRAVLFVLFGLVLLIPQTLALRRRRTLWNGLRFLTAVVGALLIGSGKGGELGVWALPAGVAFLALALLARPAKEGKTVDAVAKELGALIVLNGGRLRLGSQDSAAQLFLSPEALHVLDLRHEPLLEIPLAAVREVRATPDGNNWKLVVESEAGATAFQYDGFFAEHLARVAETTLRSQLRRELPVLK
jgi:hypothetical protein